MAIPAQTKEYGFLHKHFGNPAVITLSSIRPAALRPCLSAKFAIIDVLYQNYRFVANYSSLDCIFQHNLTQLGLFYHVFPPLKWFYIPVIK